jgi:hypothetical protein
MDAFDRGPIQKMKISRFVVERSKSATT